MFFFAIKAQLYNRCTFKWFPFRTLHYFKKLDMDFFLEHVFGDYFPSDRLFAFISLWFSNLLSALMHMRAIY